MNLFEVNNTPVLEALYDFNDSIYECISEMYICHAICENLGETYLSESVSEKFNKIKDTIISKIKEFIRKIKEWFEKIFKGLKTKNINAKQFLKQNESKIKEKLKNWKNIKVDELTTVNDGLAYMEVQEVYLNILHNYSEDKFINSDMTKSELIKEIIDDMELSGYGVKKGTYTSIQELMERVRDTCIKQENNFNITKDYIEYCVKVINTVEKSLTKEMTIYNELIKKSNDTIKSIQSMKDDTQEDTKQLNREIMYYETLIELGNQVLSKTTIITNDMINVSMNTIKKYVLS